MSVSIQNSGNLSYNGVHIEAYIVSGTEDTNAFIKSVGLRFRTFTKSSGSTLRILITKDSIAADINASRRIKTKERKKQHTEKNLIKINSWTFFK
jgi:hypothetical protein